MNFNLTEEFGIYIVQVNKAAWHISLSFNVCFEKLDIKERITAFRYNLELDQLFLGYLSGTNLLKLIFDGHFF